MKQGYVLLEVIIATAISAILSVMMLSSVTQLSKGVAASYGIMSRDARMMLFLKQVEHDLSAALVPRVAQEDDKEKKQQETANQQPQKPPQQQPGAPVPEQAAKKITLEPLAEAFLLEQDGQGLQELSFFTTSSLPSYGIAKQRMTRVTYTLEPEGQKKQSFALMRKESTDTLQASSQEKSTAGQFLLIEGIKSINVECVAYLHPKEEKKGDATTSNATDKKDAKKEPKKKKIIVEEWPTDEVEEHGATLLPHHVRLKVVFWDSNYKRETAVLYTIPIIAPDEVPLKQKKKADQKPPSQDTTTGNQPSPPPAPNSAGGGKP